MQISDRVVVSCLLDNDEGDFLRLANFVTTAAAFGGAMRAARFIARVAGEVPPALERALGARGMEVRTAPAGERYGYAALELDDDLDVLVVVPVETLVAGDFSDFIQDDAIGVVHDPAESVSVAEMSEMLRRFSLPAGTAGDGIFSAEVLTVPGKHVRALARAWREYAAALREPGRDASVPPVPGARAELIAFNLALRSLRAPLSVLGDDVVVTTDAADDPVRGAPPPRLVLQRSAAGSASPYRNARVREAMKRVETLIAGIDQAGAGPAPRAAPEPALVARLGALKREALESFLDFTEGGAMPAYPLEVFLEVSNVCNLKCAMCRDFSQLNPNRFQTLRNEERGFLSKASFAGAMDQVLRHALVVHCFGFGEPTVHPEFRGLLEYLSRYEVLVDFFTNGMNLDAELCEFLVRRRVGGVTVSFSGATKADYENVYLGGDFERVLGGIARLAETKRRLGAETPRILINSLSFQHHIDRLPEFMELMARHGANHVFVKQLLGEDTNPVVAHHIAVYRPWIEGQLVDAAATTAARLGIGLSADQFVRYAATSEEDAERIRTGVIMNSKSRAAGADVLDPGLIPIERFKELAAAIVPTKPVEASGGYEPPTTLDVPARDVNRIMEIDLPPKPVANPCMEPFKTLYVRRNGRVKPCCFADGRKPALGDIARHGGLEAWRGAGYTALREGILRGEYPAGCRTCVDIGYGPWSHFLKYLTGDYDFWHGKAFGTPFLDDAMRRRVLGTAENADIARRHHRLHSTLAAVDGATEARSGVVAAPGPGRR
jgi:MoaA/NifB/PqqE/SkfB family radical SAM enzyme